MPLSWNEIRSNAYAFSKEWLKESREEAEAKTFWDDFIRMFGLTRRHVASFEAPVKTLKGTYGFIDMFWKGLLIVEHKSRGKELGKAHTQAMEYIQSLQREKRGDEIPRYVIVSDFARIALHDLEEGTSTEFALSELPKRIQLFGFIPGYQQHRLEPDNPLNIRAVAIMGELHDSLEAGGYKGHHLERMLVRVLFCLFAEDTGIFERNALQQYLLDHTKDDGSDLGSRLAEFFQILNTPENQRQSNLLEELTKLPYVNGDLFSEFLGFAAFNREMRNALLICTRFDWSRISPAVFGALFQSVMEPKERRQKGAHYTSERDILKTIGPLFLDELKESLEKAGTNKSKLKAFMEGLGRINLFDPACGCGNFLVVAYRELRLLELEALKRYHNIGGDTEHLQQLLDTSVISIVDVDQLYGIEIEEWPARIAEVALWLMDHQMNLRLSEVFGKYYVRLPLIKSPHIVHANSLRIDWNTVLSASQCNYITGNPPFVGKAFRTTEQVADMNNVWGDSPGANLLDYVTCWFKKCAEYSRKTSIETALVSTNSIVQGEQVAILWGALSELSINFAHRTFSWSSEAKGKANVHVVIVGFSEVERSKKRLFDYEEGMCVESNPSRLNAYLVDGPKIIVQSRTKALCKVPEIVFGSMPNDGGALTLDDIEKDKLLREAPNAEQYIRKFLGAVEFINGISRWCIWLVGASPNTLRELPGVMQRIEACKKHRLASSRPTTKKLANTPSLFGEIRQPNTEYLLIPSVSSEKRKYIPVGFCHPSIIASNLTLIVPNATLFHFGVLSSSMHMAWVRTVCGRLKSDYRYSAKLVYNNYPWPAPTDKQIENVEREAISVLEARANYPDSTLADLYDPRSMPPDLVNAHDKLDRAVEKCYRSASFTSERSRVEFLFERYQMLATPLIKATKGKRNKAQDKSD